MDKRVITISREFGSGGRTIARKVATGLGYRYYDKELVEQVALETGFDPQYVEERGEEAPGNSSLSYSFMPPGVPGVMQGMSAADFLWSMQRSVILSLADKEPCVIVGRCADFILRDRADSLHIFIHADDAFRAKRIVSLYGESETSPEKRLQEKDRKRMLNYRHYTHREWGMCQNYHLSLRSDVIGIDRCADLIVSLAKDV